MTVQGRRRSRPPLSHRRPYVNVGGVQVSIIAAILTAIICGEVGILAAAWAFRQGLADQRFEFVIAGAIAGALTGLPIGRLGLLEVRPVGEDRLWAAGRWLVRRLAARKSQP